jgi:hypothetical protein
MVLLGELTAHRAGPCQICGGRCLRFPDVDHLATYPFLPGGRDPMAETEHIIASERVVDHELGRVVYSPGDRVPLDDAIRYGLIDKPPAKKAAKRPKGKRKPAEDRARKRSEDR